MVRYKDAGPAAVGRSSAIQKYRKRNRHYYDRNRPSALQAKPILPKSRHKTILEWAENADKKKKLDIEVTSQRHYCVLDIY